MCIEFLGISHGSDISSISLKIYYDENNNWNISFYRIFFIYCSTLIACLCCDVCVC
jgi:hypothetical protein